MEFLDRMTKLAEERKYTLGFVFSERWSFEREVTEEDYEIPSMLQFKEALSSCVQWPLDVVNCIEQCIIDYREAVVHVMEDKSTYIDAQASIDQISTSLYRQQYLNWEASEETRRRRDRYKNLCLVFQHSHTFAASLVSPEVRLLSEEVESCKLDDSEFEMDVKDLIKLRLTLRKEKEKEALSKLQSLHARSAQDAEMPTRSRLWSYSTWLTGGATNSTDSSGHNTEGVRIEDVK
ncbi:hypothetical protein PsorP6_011176 [Peronosclerospora sorghi]|uniref:Uncharacterized protein n=1 Tax=Peronosclerospora sorghi TaxID=230839 RepID=A0ACC0VVI3_9STRA|nr:hypothetical protein PsorP6_011176 [Peronosclerospora sorghi]